MKMKTSLKKLRELGLNHKDKRDHRRLQRSRPRLDEIARASKDMQDMKDCYDSLYSAAAATANSAFEFSESLRDMGACLLEKTALNDDEDSGRVLLMLGKLQFELQELVDRYRSHIYQTITVPSESLLNEIRIVEEMKKQCDEKRRSYESMITTHQDKKSSKHSKGETYCFQKVQAARDEYEEETTLFLFRLKSLKQGQSRSLLTQAARHHAAQLRFFKKALHSVESVEPYVQSVTEQNHIDYLFSGLEDNTGDNDCGVYDDEDSNGTTCDDDGYRDDDNAELSFDYRQNNPMGIVVSTPGSSVEEKFDKKPNGATSQSAPLAAAEKNLDNKRSKELQSSNSRKFHSYVLPTPIEGKNPIPTRPSTQPLEPKRTSLSGIALNYRHSSPLEPMKYSRSLRSDKPLGPFVRVQSPDVRGTNENSAGTDFPPLLIDEVPSQSYDRYFGHDAEKFQRQSFSGPLIGMPRSNQIAVSASGPIPSKANTKLYSGTISHSPPRRPLSSSPKQSPSASPTFVSSPKISELHVLPRPPQGHIGVSLPLPMPPQLTLAS